MLELNPGSFDSGIRVEELIAPENLKVFQQASTLMYMFGVNFWSDLLKIDISADAAQKLRKLNAEMGQKMSEALVDGGEEKIDITAANWRNKINEMLFGSKYAELMRTSNLV